MRQAALSGLDADPCGCRVTFAACMAAMSVRVSVSDHSAACAGPAPRLIRLRAEPPWRGSCGARSVLGQEVQCGQISGVVRVPARVPP